MTQSVGNLLEIEPCLLKEMNDSAVHISADRQWGTVLVQGSRKRSEKCLHRSHVYAIRDILCSRHYSSGISDAMRCNCGQIAQITGTKENDDCDANLQRQRK